MAILFSDDEFKNQYYGVNSFRMALWMARDIHQIKGRIYCKHQRITEAGCLHRTYKLAHSDYEFTLSRGLTTAEICNIQSIKQF
jgi:hypothetical protein